MSKGSTARLTLAGVLTTASLLIGAAGAFAATPSPSASPALVGPWRQQVSGEHEHLKGSFALDCSHAWFVGEEAEAAPDPLPSPSGSPSSSPTASPSPSPSPSPFFADQSVVSGTTDGGATWIAQKLPPGTAYKTTLNRVVFLDALNGYIAGEPGHLDGSTKPNILRTIAGGFTVGTTSTWVDVSAGLPGQTNGHDIEGLAAVGNHVWIAVGPYIVHSGDRGTTWDPVQVFNDAGNGDFSSVSMADALNGYATSDNGRLWRTVNGGVNWTDTSATLQNAEQVVALSATSAVIVEEVGTIEYTTNSGTTLTAATLPDLRGPSLGIPDIRDVSFNSAGVGYASGDPEVAGDPIDDHVLRSTDSGKNWTLVATNTELDTGISTVAVSKAGDFAWAGGEGGKISSNHAAGSCGASPTPTSGAAPAVAPTLPKAGQTPGGTELKLGFALVLVALLGIGIAAARSGRGAWGGDSSN